MYAEGKEIILYPFAPMCVPRVMLRQKEGKLSQESSLVPVTNVENRDILRNVMVRRFATAVAELRTIKRAAQENNVLLKVCLKNDENRLKKLVNKME